VREHLKRHFLDALIVLAVVGAILEFVLAPSDSEYAATASLWFLIPASIVTIGTLLLRRRLPFGAPVAVLVLVAAISFVEGNFAPGSFAVFLATITSALLLGMAPERRQALAGIAVCVAVVAIAIRNQPTGGLDDLVFVTLVLTCAWVAGFALKSKLAEAEARRVRAEEEAREAVAEERGRIARELHDVVAHSVSVMTVQAGAVRRLLTPEQVREREALLTVEQTGRQALTEMRRLLDVLRREGESAALAPQPGLANVAALVDQVRDAGVPVELTYEGERIGLPPGVDLCAYRIVQEALTNALKHAGPARAWVAVRYRSDEVEVEVANDGRSAENGSGDGHGLVGMRERVALCGGDLTTGPRPGGGYTISARLPVTGSAP
jgi:signal transduction histidine kinase